MTTTTSGAESAITGPDIIRIFELIESAGEVLDDRQQYEGLDTDELVDALVVSQGAFKLLSDIQQMIEGELLNRYEGTDLKGSRGEVTLMETSGRKGWDNKRLRDAVRPHLLTTPTGSIREPQDVLERCEQLISFTGANMRLTTLSGFGIDPDKYSEVTTRKRLVVVKK